MKEYEVKEKIYKKAKELGANLVRSCSVNKWKDIPIQEPEFWSQNIWPCGVCASIHCQSFGS